MAKQTINIGTVAGDGTGDGLRTALDKVNDNFTELYDADTSGAAALALKAPLASPALTGTPTGPTAATTTNTTQLATTAFVQQELNSMLDGAPAALNTLNELAAAVNDDASFAATVTTALGGKAATDRKLDDFGAPDDNTDLDATSLAHGLMPKADKSKLDGIEAAADVTDAGNVGAAIHGATEKTTPVNADKIAIIDTEAGNVLKWLSWTNVKATLKTYFDTLYAAITHTHAQSDITNLVSDLSGKAATSRKLDDFGAPDDNTDLNATTSAHGLLPKLGGGTTNFLRADGTWAAPAGGGSSISTPKVCYVSTTGDNGTAVVGNPALPFATSQAAFNAGVALAAPFRIHWYAGSHGSITVAADMAHTCTLTGEGFNASVLSGIIADGAVGSNAPGDDLPGGDGSPGWALLLDSDGSVDVGSVSTLGGAGGMVGGGVSPQPGGGGGANGPARLRGVWGSSTFASEGGAGGMGGGGGSTGTPGGGASVTLLGCVFGGSIGIGTGSGAAAGTVRVSRCVAGSAIGVTASSGFVTQCIGSSLSVTGPADTGNTTGADAHLLA